MSWKNRFELAKGKANLLKQAALEQAGITLDQHWALIRDLWVEKVDPSLRSAVMDDEKLTSYLRIVHEALPLPIRLAVKEETFIRVCLKNRDRWLPKDAHDPAAEKEKPQLENKPEDET